MTVQDSRTAWDVDTWDLDAWDVDAWDVDGWEFDDDAEDTLLGPEVAVPGRSVMVTLPLEERTRIIDAYIRRELARVLLVAPRDIDVAGRTMNSLGVGSVAGLQLQNRIERALEVEVNLQMLLLASSAQELIDCLAGQLGPEGHDNGHRNGHGHRVRQHA
ncbi:acyl carrier protein [Streptomyces sp. NPDC050315]|uniref:acyl carrier protein n=1 Tax=Streptomyces sp. NPDC050315 TaxID=3155039 RepID=UPI0034290696